MADKSTPDCHPFSSYGGRGLCRACYKEHAKAGTLEQFPRKTLPAADFADRYMQMRAAGLSRSEMAEKIGIDRHAIAQAYYRAVRRGEVTPDPERVSCGTDGGYQAHLRHREPTCRPCRAAHAARERNIPRRATLAESKEIS